MTYFIVFRFNLKGSRNCHWLRSFARSWPNWFMHFKEWHWGINHFNGSAYHTFCCAVGLRAELQNPAATTYGYVEKRGDKCRAPGAHRMLHFHSLHRIAIELKPSIGLDIKYSCCSFRSSSPGTFFTIPFFSSNNIFVCVYLNWMRGYTHTVNKNERLERDFKILSQRIAFNRSLARIKYIQYIKMVWYNHKNNKHRAISH